MHILVSHVVTVAPHEGTGVKLAADVANADFILNSGTNTIRTGTHIESRTAIPGSD